MEKEAPQPVQIEESDRNQSHLFAPKTHDIAERGQVATDENGNPLIEFDQVAVRKLRRKIDLYVLPTACIIYLFQFIDRTNIGNARIAGIEEDLGMGGFDYNRLLSVFYVSYAVFEFPGMVMCKYMGPGWFLPICTVGFGICTIGMGFVQNLGAAYAVRFLLGIFEAAVLPGIAYYLTRWYRRDELTFRLAIYQVMVPFAGAIGGLLSSGILRIDNIGSLTRWRMIFGIEGIITTAIGLIALATMTDSPVSARWLSQDEKDLAIARLKAERLGTTVVLDSIHKKKMIRGAISPCTLTVGFIFLLGGIISQGLSIFLPTIIRSIYPDRSVIAQQLQTVPPYAVGVFCNLFFPYVSYRLDRRQIFLITAAPFCMLGYAMFIGSSAQQVRFAATFFVAAGIFQYGTFNNACVSANVMSDAARAAAIGTNTLGANIGGLIATWTYLPFDAPDYYRGNGIGLATSTTIFLTAIALYAFMKIDNRKRENNDVHALLSGLNEDEIQSLEWKHPGFKWKL